MVSCNWLPRTTCTNRVRFTLTANGKNYDLGAIPPELYALSLKFALIPASPNPSSPIDGYVSVPQAVNLGRDPIAATVTGAQILDLGSPVLGCIDLAKKMSGPVPLMVAPAASDGSVITNLQPAATTIAKQGTPLTIGWTLRRAGEVRIRVFYLLTAGRELSVRPGASPADAVLDEQRPAGADQFALPLADLSGRAFPAGSYRYMIELIDPQGSGVVAATPKSGTFSVALAL